MKDNLVYGNSILDFGAVGDGKADDTKAFADAFACGVTLISVPYGKYRITKPLKINSGLKIHCHSKAVINHSGIIAESGAESITVSGGIWCSSGMNFDLHGVTGCTLENLTLSGMSNDCLLKLTGSGDILLENISFHCPHTGNGLELHGSVSDLHIYDLCFDGCMKAIVLEKNADIKCVYGRKLLSKDCEVFMAARECSVHNSLLTDISGDAWTHTFSASKSEISGLKLRGIAVSDGYFNIEHCNTSDFTVENFKRLTESEKNPTAPSLTVSGSECTLICDGLPLDAVILSKKSIPDVKMTAAKMAHPLPSAFRYTVEIPLTEKHSYVLPIGDFDSLTIFN